MTPLVAQLRIALTVQDFEGVLAFYRDGLGLDPGEMWISDGARGALLNAGAATLEVFDEGQARMVDDLEVGQRVSGPVRLAFEVSNLDEALQRAMAYGAVLVHAPVITPWGDRNARVKSPDGLQITLFEPAEKPE